ncbi:MAG: cyclic nucleotide-binding domain-containing protein [Chloroflexi bacterium]|nr:cyclic nucleotide-binding domain-containing protein [Chloroflexota bacterium]
METLETLIAEHPFWKGLSRQHLPLVSESASLVRFKTGQRIYEEGKAAEYFYLICRGKVALEAYVPGKGSITIQTIGRGDALGWSWLFPPYRWHFQATALEETDAIAWETCRLRDQAESNHDFGYELLKRMAHVLLQRLQASRMQLLDFYDTTG